MKKHFRRTLLEILPVMYVVSKQEKVKKTIPNGCQIFYFSKSAELITPGQGEDVFFECVALNENSARKKLDKFFKNNKPF